MLELLTSFSLEDLSFLALAVMIILSSVLAIIVNNVRATVISFLIASCLLCSLIATISEPLFAIVISSVYISISALFLVFFRRNKQIELLTGKYLVPVILLFIALIGLFAKLPATNILTIKTSHYSGIAGITLIIAIMLIFLVFGVVSIVNQKNNS